MKTKIIYISGNEVFEMAEIRAAFDQVRSALGLGADTVLFGVPVDCDCALASDESDESGVADVSVVDAVATPDDVISDAPIIDNVVAPVSTVDSVSKASDEIVPAPESEIVDQIVEIATPEPAPAQEVIVDSLPETPVYVDTDIPETVETVAEPESAPETEPESDPEPETDKVIPILSILSSQEKKIEPMADVEPITVSTVAETVSISSVEISNEPEIEPESEPEIEPESEPMPDSAEKIDLDKMIDDDMPSAPSEKTIEHLLASMTPLREDVDSTPAEESPDTTPDVSSFDGNDDTDATLAKLASEFAETQDKIVVPTKSKGNGKIEKLKGIISFKPRREENSGFIGDLFNWAGAAANDDDFSLPGFFND
ncbi:MAG: hypothetical protein IJ517_02335 [Alphaproteobacteria bacterium]|nr:hypothetical protein [Alphaproteobacteria bacterium]